MAYRFKRRRTLASEVRRIADTQLAAAVASLDSIGTHAQDEAVHAARRHIKKVRALVQLVRRPLGAAYKPAHRRLDRAIAMLATIADSEELVDVCDRPWTTALPASTRELLKKALRARETRIDRCATAAGVLPRAAASLRRLQREARGWRLTMTGFRAVAPGLERGVRRLHKARRRALERPTSAHMRRWRRRVKDLWYVLRLLERRCGRALTGDLRRLEQLDGVLGEYHNIRLLGQVLVAEPLLPRAQTLVVLRGLRRAQHNLAQRARTLSETVPREDDRAFTRRVRQAWMAERRRQRGRSWRRAA
jgi:hypothetical protein